MNDKTCHQQFLYSVADMLVKKSQLKPQEGEREGVNICNNMGGSGTEVTKKIKSKPKPQEGEWISVKDRLPKKDSTYTVGNPEYESGECFFEDGKWAEHNLNPYNEIYITHWKTLPTPPKG